MFQEQFSKQQIHDYRQRQPGQDYYLEPVRQGTLPPQQFLMTSWGHTIKLNDYILLETEGSSTCCKVEQIDYDFSRLELWTAILAPCSEEFPG